MASDLKVTDQGIAEVMTGMVNIMSHREVERKGDRVDLLHQRLEEAGRSTSLGKAFDDLRESSQLARNQPIRRIKVNPKVDILDKTQYTSVFKRDLGKEDRVRMDPVKVNLIDSSKDNGNAMIAVETPRHLQDAASEELSRLLKAVILEPVHHPTKNCSRAFFVEKNNKDGTIKARLVTDLCKVNPNLERVGTPLDGSSHILKRMEPEDTMFAS